MDTIDLAFIEYLMNRRGLRLNYDDVNYRMDGRDPLSSANKYLWNIIDSASYLKVIHNTEIRVGYSIIVSN